MEPDNWTEMDEIDARWAHEQQLEERRLQEQIRLLRPVHPWDCQCLRCEGERARCHLQDKARKANPARYEPAGSFEDKRTDR